MKKWVFLFSLCSILFIFRKALLIAVVKIALLFSLSASGASLTYEKIGWEKGLIRLEAVCFARSDIQIFIDEVNISLGGRPFAWQADCQIVHPQIHVERGSSPLAPCYFFPRLRFLTLFWQVQEGVVEFSEYPPLYFTVLEEMPSLIDHPNASRKSKITLSYQEQKADCPLCSIELKEQQGQFAVCFSLKEEHVERLKPLLSLCLPGWIQNEDLIEGGLDASGTLKIDQDGIPRDINCSWQTQKLALTNASKGLSFNIGYLAGQIALPGRLTFNRLCQVGETQIVIQDTHCVYNALLPYHFQIEKAQWSTRPDQEPFISLNGICRDGDDQLGFCIQGTGQCPSNSSFVCTLQCALADMCIDMSLCRFEEEKYAIQCTCNAIQLDLLAFFSNLIPSTFFQDIAQCKFEFPLSSWVAMVYEQGALNIDADIACGEEKLHIGADFKNKKFVEGWFETQAISQATFTPFLRYLPFEVPLKGTLQCQGNFDPSYLVVALQSRNCQLAYEWGDLFLGEKQSEWVYSIKDKKCKGEISLKNAYLLHKDPTLNVECIDATVDIDGCELRIPAFSGIYQTVSLHGTLDRCTIDPHLHTLSVKNGKVQGSLFDYGLIHLNLIQGVLDYKEKPVVSFHLDLEQDKKRVLSIKATATNREEGEWDVAFDQKASEIFATALPCERLKIQLDRNVRKGILLEASHREWGDFYTECSIEKNKLIVKQCKGRYKGLEIDGAGICDLLTQQFTLSLNHLQGSFAQGSFCGQYTARGALQGRCSLPLDLKAELNCTACLVKPFPMTLWNAKPFKLSYLQDALCHVEGLALYFKGQRQNHALSSFAIEKLFVNPLSKECRAQGCSMRLWPCFLQECLDTQSLPVKIDQFLRDEQIEASGEIGYTPQDLTIKATLKDTTACFKKTPLALQQIALHCERGVLTLQAKTGIGQNPLWAALNVSLTKNQQGILRITDHPRAEGMRFYFRMLDGNIAFEKIQGECCGLNCALVKSQAKKYPAATLLSGRIEIDGTKLCSFLPGEIQEKFQQFKLGKGYSWEGECILRQEAKRRFQFTGQLTGQEWECLGYRFKHLQAAIDVHPESLFISNVKVEDQAGCMSIKRIAIEKQNGWQLSIPLISIQEWHPSSMRKCDATSLTAKPFLIRNFTLSKIHANLSQKQSLEGYGQLTFTNQIKKESSLFDAPLEMIKNLGLDPGLLTPVQGEVEFDLKGDKLYLVGLKNTFSQAKRSEFYLAPERKLSYIDLEGKMHIDLRMQQDVALKLTEPFVLTIRGTLDNPRYGLELQ